MFYGYKTLSVHVDVKDCFLNLHILACPCLLTIDIINLIHHAIGVMQPLPAITAETCYNSRKNSV